MKRSAVIELPRAFFFTAATLFTLSMVGTLVALGIFFWYDTDFWEYFAVGPVLKVAVILSGLSVSSGLLFIHCRSQESYMTFESTFFLSCFSLSLLNLLWIAPVLFFL
jgi:hypothetical protein